MPLEWVHIFIYDWIVNFPPQYINGLGLISNDILVSKGHVFTNPCSFFIDKRNSSIIML